MTEPQTSSNYIIPYRPAVRNERHASGMVGHQREETVHLERQLRTVYPFAQTNPEEGRTKAMRF
jgi:hypothetical protein